MEMDWISDKLVTTRKPHTCLGCLTVFPAGSKMHSRFGADNREAARHYMCVRCDLLIAANPDLQEWYANETIWGFVREWENYPENKQRNKH
jgi:hypothetical protein